MQEMSWGCVLQERRGRKVVGDTIAATLSTCNTYSVTFAQLNVIKPFAA